jgi:sulfur carrier protein
VKGKNKMKVNGTYTELTVKQSLLDFLVSQNHDISRIAVELNGEIVPKATYSQVSLDNGDTLEIVRFVGGG